MKCVNCGTDAGRKGNKHVHNRRFTCQRTARELRTKRNWLGRREEFYVDVDVDSIAVPYSLSDWTYGDERSYVRSDYYDSVKPSYSYESPSRSDDWSSRSSSSDSGSSWSSSDSGGSSSGWSSSGSSSSDSGSSWGSSSGGSSSGSYDSGSSSSSYE